MPAIRLCGGLSSSLAPLAGARIRAALVAPRNDALDGAICLAQGAGIGQFWALGN